MAAAAMEDQSNRPPSNAGNFELVLLQQVILAYFVKESQNADF
jgi:hypothetical protein